MHLALDITTSAEFWRRIYPADRTPKLDRFSVPERCALNQRDIDALKPSWITPEFLEPIGGKLHVFSLAGHTSKNRNRSVVHAWSGPIPEESFYDLGNNVLVQTPPFMFLVAATLLDPEQLIAFGFELCGLYGFDDTQKRGFRKRSAPLTTLSRLREYLSGAKGCRGREKALSALAYILERSASPMETYDVMCLCLPYRLGGYCIKSPKMNHRVNLTPRARRIARREKCYLDMGYPEEHLDVEHHGKLDHSSSEDRASDRARVNALREMGYEVIELTIDQVEDIEAFDYIVQRIAGILGKRIRKEYLGVTAARVRLHQKLREWNRTGGRLR